MNNFMNDYFGPLGKESCLYFYLISVFCGFSLIVLLFSIIVYLAKNYNKPNTMYLTNMALASLNLFVAYFVNRLLHTMCVRSIL